MLVAVWSHSRNLILLQELWIPKLQFPSNSVSPKIHVGDEQESKFPLACLKWHTNFQITFQNSNLGSSPFFEEGEQIEVVNNADLAEAVAAFEAIGRVISFSILPRSIETGESDESSESDPEGRKPLEKSLSQAQRSPSWTSHWSRSSLARACPYAWDTSMRHETKNAQGDTLWNAQDFFNNGNTDACIMTCDLQCTFVSDATFADDTAMKPNQSFNKNDS